MDVLLETNDLKITFEKGSMNSNKTILSFTGISHGLGGIQKEEFARSLKASNKIHDVYYVIDKQQSWYNTTYDHIYEFLCPRLADREIYTLGNSMGGFGALLFSSALANCKTAIAFCPQYFD